MGCDYRVFRLVVFPAPWYINTKHTPALITIISLIGLLWNGEWTPTRCLKSSKLVRLWCRRSCIEPDMEWSISGQLIVYTNPVFLPDFSSIQYVLRIRDISTSSPHPPRASIAIAGHKFLQFLASLYPHSNPLFSPNFSLISCLFHVYLDILSSTPSSPWNTHCHSWTCRSHFIR